MRIQALRAGLRQAWKDRTVSDLTEREQMRGRFFMDSIQKKERIKAY